MTDAPGLLQPAVAAATAAVTSLTSSARTALTTATAVARQRPWAAASLAAGTLTLLCLLSTSRRSSDDAAFKRALRRQKRARSRQPTATATARSVDADVAAEARAMEEIVSAPIPNAPEAREQFFQEYVARGEALVEQGPAQYNLAAACFYTALKVYPAPTELVHLYQHTLPDPVFAAVLALISAEAAHRHAAYYAHFPPPAVRSRVSIVESPAPDLSTGSSRTFRRVLVAATDFARGTPMFAESALVACPSARALAGATHCAYCLARITADAHVAPQSPLAFCSSTCESASWDRCDSHLFATGDAGRDLVAACVRDGTSVPLLAARVLARMTRDELRAAEAGESPVYGVWDHVERWRYADSADPALDAVHAGLVRAAIAAHVPAAAEFVTAERYAVLKGRVVYNVYGKGGRAVEGGLDEGVGLFPVVAYAAHACDANARVVMGKSGENGAPVVTVVAKRDVRQGERVTVAYADGVGHAVGLREGWSVECDCAVE
ncbi:hypothetical protein GGF31_005297 [Allomyces arbusculus]|nr:hypothetical protein GGF31_005297 [Allomyces arbusculus]